MHGFHGNLLYDSRDWGGRPTNSTISRVLQKVSSGGAVWFYFKLVRGDGIQILPNAGHHWSDNKIQFKLLFAGGQMIAKI